MKIMSSKKEHEFGSRITNIKWGLRGEVHG